MSRADELADSISRIDTFTEYQRVEVLAAASELRRLSAVNAELRGALKEARADVLDWACYASAYYQERHDLAGDLARIDAAIQKAEEA